MTMRKYIITFAVTLASLCCGHAQMNPLADSLFTHVLSMPFSSSDFDEKGICIRRGGVTYHLAEFKDSINYRNVEEPENELCALKEMCHALSKEAQKSYMWELVENGTDTLMYLLTLDNPSGKETIKLMYSDKNVRFETLDEDGTSELEPKGAYSFEYHLENGDKPSNYFVDVADMTRRIKPILNQEGIESHDLYIRHDGSYPTSSEGMDWVTTALNYKTLPYDSETRGTVYTIPSKEMADEVFLQLQDAISQYLQEHPRTHCFKYPNKSYERERWQFDLIHSRYWNGYSEPKNKKKGTIAPREYRITFYPPGNRRDGICRILVQQTRGDLWLPSGWQKMKSWINGESVFYKELNE